MCATQQIGNGVRTRGQREHLVHLEVSSAAEPEQAEIVVLCGEHVSASLACTARVVHDTCAREREIGKKIKENKVGIEYRVGRARSHLCK